jgi:hypothetical protein
VDLTAITGSVAKLFTSDMTPLVIGFIVVLLILTLLRNVIRIATRAALIVVAVVVVAFFVSGSANATTGTDGVKNVISQVGKGVTEFTGSPVDPTPYMDIQRTYQNIVNQLKAVQAVSAAR